MNYSKYRFNLDMQSYISQISLPVRQHDTGIVLQINLTDGGVPYVIKDGCRAVFYARKSDGNPLMNDCIIEKNTTICYELTQQTTSCSGVVDCEVRLYGSDGNLITTPRFILVIDSRVVHDEDFPLSESEQTVLDNIILSEQQRLQNEVAREENYNELMDEMRENQDEMLDITKSASDIVKTLEDKLDTGSLSGLVNTSRVAEGKIHIVEGFGNSITFDFVPKVVFMISNGGSETLMTFLVSQGLGVGVSVMGGMSLSSMCELNGTIFSFKSFTFTGEYRYVAIGNDIITVEIVYPPQAGGESWNISVTAAEGSMWGDWCKKCNEQYTASGYPMGDYWISQYGYVYNTFDYSYVADKSGNLVKWDAPITYGEYFAKDVNTTRFKVGGVSYTTLSGFTWDEFTKYNSDIFYTSLAPYNNSGNVYIRGGNGGANSDYELFSPSGGVVKYTDIIIPNAVYRFYD